jgi:hypothetical protein
MSLYGTDGRSLGEVDGAIIGFAPAHPFIHLFQVES